MEAHPAYQILETVCDPEVPVLSILDLGIVKEVRGDKDKVNIRITPTYSGCPAMDMISVNIKAALQEEGYKEITVELTLDPAWTTDWMSEEGKRKLKEYGIAPPVGSADKTILLGDKKVVHCPLCNSADTELLSAFGSTACKAMYRCITCREPFDYFKCH